MCIVFKTNLFEEDTFVGLNFIKEDRYLSIKKKYFSAYIFS
jgi:hypothetical protein